MSRASRSIRRVLARYRIILGAVGGSITVGVGGFVVKDALITRTYPAGEPRKESWRTTLRSAQNRR